MDLVGEEPITAPVTSSTGSKKRRGGAAHAEEDDKMEEEEPTTSARGKASTKIAKNPKSKKLTDSNPDVAELPTGDL